MPKTTVHLNGHRQRTFAYNGSTVTVLRPTNRDRERFRQLILRLNGLNLGYSGGTLSEFAAAVVYTISGDDHLWDRPSPEGSNTELVAAFEQWLDLDAEYVDELFTAQASSPDPVTSPHPLSENADPNS